MSIHQRKSMLLGSAAALLLLCTPAAVANAAESVSPPGPFDMGEATMLKHLPSGSRELTFSGESVRRSFSVALSDAEAKGTKVFQLAFRNTVAALPERSELKLSVNGLEIATVPVNASAATAVMPLTLPSGALKAGANKVDISVVMAHRVDCSVAATYELWTTIDPAQTGFVVAASAGEDVRSIAELAAGSMAQNGTTPIVLRTQGELDPLAIARAGRFIGALVNRAGLVRPVVETSADAGHDMGFDVVLATDTASGEAMASLRTTGREDGVVFARDPATNRLVLIVSAADAAGLDKRIAAFAAKTATPHGRAAGDVEISGETVIPFSDLGLETDNFGGRHYSQSFTIELPADFYPTHDDKAQLLIDGSYATELDPTSKLMVRVNGSMVATLRLGTERQGTLQHVPMNLPLRSFHPGRNEIVLDGTLTMAADRQCDPAAMPKGGTRLSLLDTSELAFPHFAHFGTSPHIAGALDSLHNAVADTRLYLSDAGPATVGTGLTVLANMAASGQLVTSPLVRIGPVAETDAPGIVVAPWSNLPASLSGALAPELNLADATPAPATPTPPPPPPKADAKPRGRATWHVQDAMALGLAEATRGLHAQALLDKANQLLQQQGFIFDAGAPGTLPFTDHTLLIAAVDPRLHPKTIANIAIPRFVSTPREWLVVTAADTSVLAEGIDRLVSGGRWPDLQGQVVSLDIAKDAFVSVPLQDGLYVMPAAVSLRDVAPILGGLMSTNIELSLAGLLALMLLLGVSTHIVIRRSGAK